MPYISEVLLFLYISAGTVYIFYAIHILNKLWNLPIEIRKQTARFIYGSLPFALSSLGLSVGGYMFLSVNLFAILAAIFFFMIINFSLSLMENVPKENG